YTDMIRIGRILREPEMVHEAVKRFRDFFPNGFFADGWRMEGTPSYHNQAVTLTNSVVKSLKGYVDPVDWKGERFDNLDLAKETPLYKKALDISRGAVLPNGRFIPLNDTWGYDRIGITDSTVSRLWPAMGNAVLGV